MSRYIITVVENGLMLRDCTEKQTYVFEISDGDTKEDCWTKAAKDMLVELSYKLGSGWSDGRYSSKRIKIDLEPGDKYVDYKGSDIP